MATDQPPAEEERRPLEPGDVLTGIAASRGVVRGTARVVRSSAEARERLQPGDILVCDSTLSYVLVDGVDDGSLFTIIGGVVADLNSVISKGALMARKCGIPAVLSTQVGTRVIRDGMTLTVDGTKRSGAH